MPGRLLGAVQRDGRRRPRRAAPRWRGRERERERERRETKRVLRRGGNNCANLHPPRVVVVPRARARAEAEENSLSTCRKSRFHAPEMPRDASKSDSEEDASMPPRRQSARAAGRWRWCCSTRKCCRAPETSSRTRRCTARANRPRNTASRGTRVSWEKAHRCSGRAVESRETGRRLNPRAFVVFRRRKKKCRTQAVPRRGESEPLRAGARRRRSARVSRPALSTGKSVERARTGARDSPLSLCESKKTWLSKCVSFSDSEIGHVIFRAGTLWSGASGGGPRHSSTTKPSEPSAPNVLSRPRGAQNESQESPQSSQVHKDPKRLPKTMIRGILKTRNPFCWEKHLGAGRARRASRCARMGRARSA